MKKIGLLFEILRYLIRPISGKVSGVFILHGCRNTILPNTERLYRGQGQHVCLAHWSCLEVSSSLGAADTHSTLLLLRLLPRRPPFYPLSVLTTKMTSDDIQRLRNCVIKVALALQRVGLSSCSSTPWDVIALCSHTMSSIYSLTTSLRSLLSHDPFQGDVSDSSQFCCMPAW